MSLHASPSRPRRSRAALIPQRSGRSRGSSSSSQRSGIATGAPGSDLSALFEAADRELYAQKATRARDAVPHCGVVQPGSEFQQDAVPQQRDPSAEAVPIRPVHQEQPSGRASSVA